MSNYIYDIEEMPPYNFTFEYWRAGSLAVFGIQTRTYSIAQNRNTIRKYAIGYLKGEKLWVRSKENTVAVMFFYKEDHFWTHLTIEEFNICFPGLQI